MNALLDYGSSSNDSDSDSGDDEKSVKETDGKDLEKPKLPKPTLGENSLQTSVFSNPFAEAEMAKAAILEKHVKMVPGKDTMQMLNGKKICWNFRKGRCRFGHKCKYAHDSDLQKTAEELDAEKQKLKTVVCESSSTVTCAIPPQIEVETIKSTDDVVWEGVKIRKKRPGLTTGLVPSKKVIKVYKQQKLKDALK